MRAWGWGLTVLCALGVVVASLAHWPVSPSLSLGPLAATGFDFQWSTPRKTTFTALPWPTLRATDVRLANADGSVKLSAPRVEAQLDLFDLARGRFSVTGVKFKGLSAEVDLDRALQDPQFLRLPPPIRVEIQSGHAVFTRASHAPLEFDSARVALDWGGREGPLSFTANARSGGEPIVVQARIASPQAAMTGQFTPSWLHATTPPVDIDFDGNLRAFGKTQVEGRVAASLHSPNLITRALALAAPPPFSDSPILAAGHITAGRDALALDEASLTVGGQHFDGALTLARRIEGWSVEGTLDSRALDLAALFGPPPAALDGREKWSRSPILPAPNDKIDIDMRVSTAHAVWGPHQVGEAAATVLQRGGRLTIRLLEAEAYSGSLTGELNVQSNAGQDDVHFEAGLTNADLGALSAQWGGPPIEGRAALTVHFDGVGRSPAALAASAKGAARVDLGPGSISGVNFEEVLRRSQRRSLDLTRDMMVGHTRFAAGRAAVDFSNGEARIVDAAIEGPGASVQATGSLDLRARTCSARLEASQKGANGLATPDGARLAFDLAGPWSGPSITLSTVSD